MENKKWLYLYKFRSLDKFERISDILLFERYHLSHWSNLNDPMEGYFNTVLYNPNMSDEGIALKNFLIDKKELKICSFSSTFHPILLWAHYADGHRGIAIEIRVDPTKIKNIYKIQYSKHIPELKVNLETEPKKALMKKINIWSYEKEYRVIVPCELDTIEIGRITNIYFGIRTDKTMKAMINFMTKDKPINLFNTQINFDKNQIEIKNTYCNSTMEMDY